MLISNGVYLGILVIVGLIGNVYCIIQLKQSNLKKFALSSFLMALAVSDSGFLISLSLLSLYDLNYRLLNYPVFCQVGNYLSYLTCFLSDWYIAALSVERCRAVYRPFQSYYSSGDSTRARRLIRSITVVGMILNSWPLFVFSTTHRTVEEKNDTENGGGHNVTLYECEMRQEAREYYEVITLFDSIITGAIPLTVTLILNLLIIREIFAAGRDRRRMLTTGRAGSEATTAFWSKCSKRGRQLFLRKKSSNSTTNFFYRQMREKERRVAVLLLTVPLMHIALSAPNYLLRLVMAFLRPLTGGSEVTGATATLDTVFLFIFYAQFSMNFVLYSSGCSGRDRAGVPFCRKTTRPDANGNEPAPMRKNATVILFEKRCI